MNEDDEADRTPSMEFAALVVVACIVGVLLMFVATAVWRAYE